MIVKEIKNKIRSFNNCQLYIINCQITSGGVAQLARAPALQAGGQEFDSLHLHHTRGKKLETRSKRKEKNLFF